MMITSNLEGSITNTKNQSVNDKGHNWRAYKHDHRLRSNDIHNLRGRESDFGNTGRACHNHLSDY